MLLDHNKTSKRRRMWTLPFQISSNYTERWVKTMTYRDTSVGTRSLRQINFSSTSILHRFLQITWLRSVQSKPSMWPRLNQSVFTWITYRSCICWMFVIHLLLACTINTMFSATVVLYMTVTKCAYHETNIFSSVTQRKLDINVQ